jgi:hypothetical protein
MASCVRAFAGVAGSWPSVDRAFAGGELWSRALCRSLNPRASVCDWPIIRITADQGVSVFRPTPRTSWCSGSPRSISPARAAIFDERQSARLQSPLARLRVCTADQGVSVFRPTPRISWCSGMPQVDFACTSGHIRGATKHSAPVSSGPPSRLRGWRHARSECWLPSRHESRFRR